MADASEECTRDPYLTHSRPVSMRTLPFLRRMGLRALIARSMGYRYIVFSGERRGFLAEGVNGCDVLPLNTPCRVLVR